MNTLFDFTYPRALIFKANEIAGDEEEGFGLDSQLLQAISQLEEAEKALKHMPFEAKILSTYDYYLALIHYDTGNYSRELGKTAEAIEHYQTAGQFFIQLISDGALLITLGAPAFTDYLIESNLMLAKNQRNLFRLTKDYTEINSAISLLKQAMTYDSGTQAKARFCCRLAELHLLKGEKEQASLFAKNGLSFGQLPDDLESELFGYIIEAM